MALHSPHIQPERILDFGAMGTGKSHNLLNIMSWSVRTHSDAHFYCLITDNGLLDVIDAHPELVPYFHPYPVFDYPDYMAALESIRPSLRRQDWQCCDLIGDVWDACQRHFTEEVFGNSKANYFLQARVAMQIENEKIAELNTRISSSKDQIKLQKKSDTFDGWKDWSVINAMHKDFMDRFALRVPCNVFAISQADTLGDDEEQENLDTYQRFGRRPHGQKFLGHYFRTVLLSGRDRSSFLLNTVRDRDRIELVAEPVKDFAITYLKGVAGWLL